MKGVILLIAAVAFVAPAAAAQFVVGERGTNSDYPFRGC
jgi:hypothetical protein